MSNRYVWNRYNTASVATVSASGSPYGEPEDILQMDSADTFWTWNRSFRTSISTSSPIYAYTGTGRAISNGKFVLSGATSVTINDNTATESDRDSVYYRGIPINQSGGLGRVWTRYVGFSAANENAFDAIYGITWNHTTNSSYVRAISIAPSPNESGSTVTNTYIRCYGMEMSDDGDNVTATRYVVGKGSLSTTVSNASSSTYPRHNYTAQITSICAVIPAPLRRCSHVE